MLREKEVSSLINKAVAEKIALRPDSVKDADLVYIRYQIEIIDNGMGISKEGLSKLFLNFSSLAEHRK
jgi:K+-sensing histidine kinase KdpD